MKNLLIKELKLAAHPLTFVFIAFSLMTFLPGYPILMGTFFICLGLFQTFKNGREANDTMYTVLLPIEKRDAVKARFILVCTVQIAAMILMAVFTVIRMTALYDAAVYVENVMMDANLVYLAWALLVFTAFNVLFAAPFFKTAVKLGGPFIAFCVAAFVLIGAAEVLHHVPGLEALNAFGFDHILAVCIVIYIAATLLSMKAAQRSFEKVDL